MFTIEAAKQKQLQVGVEAELAAYRYKVFVEHLGWDLPIAQIGSERDQFDRPDTFYVVVKDTDERICGCARLLPTTRPYLLGSVFPQLMGNQLVPASPEIWELSRYTTQLVNGESTSRREATERFRRLLKAVCEAAFSGGAKPVSYTHLAGFEVGTKTILDVLTSQSTLLSAQSAYSQARHQFVLSGLQLKDSAGVLEVKDMEAVNSLLE